MTDTVVANNDEKSFFDRLKSIIHEQEVLAEDLKMLVVDIKEAGLDAAVLRKTATLEVKGTLSKTLKAARAIHQTAERMQLQFDLETD